MFSSYQLTGSFTMPGATVAFDSLPDGRIITIVGTSVFRETSSGSRSFTNLGTIVGDIPSYGVAFLRASPDGTRIAVGNNGGVSFGNFQVGLFTVASLNGATTGTWFPANHFDAAWVDNQYLALTAGDFGSPSSVSVLDTKSPNPASPSNVTVVDSIGGASGGIAFDAAGNLYSANGSAYTGGLSGTGAVYAIRSASWRGALSGGTPVHFDTQGIPIVDLLTGDPLGFDSAGDLVVGGGNKFTAPFDDNYFAIVRANAVAQALAGAGLISTSDTSKVMKLDPDLVATDDTYAVNVNRARSEIYATADGSTTYVYHGTPPASVPALPPAILALLGVVLVLAGGRLVRDRRA
jgi:hypothetical protein